MRNSLVIVFEFVTLISVKVGRQMVLMTHHCISNSLYDPSRCLFFATAHTTFKAAQTPFTLFHKTQKAENLAVHPNLDLSLPTEHYRKLFLAYMNIFLSYCLEEFQIVISSCNTFSREEWSDDDINKGEQKSNTSVLCLYRQWVLCVFPSIGWPVWSLVVWSVSVQKRRTHGIFVVSFFLQNTFINSNLSRFYSSVWIWVLWELVAYNQLQIY